MIHVLCWPISKGTPNKDLDTFSAHEALVELAHQLDTDGQLADNTVHIEGASAKPDELLAVCQTIPFLGSRRFVVVHGLLARFETSQRGRGRGKRRAADEEGALGGWQSFVDALPALPETTTLVLFDGEVAERNPMLAALRPHAQVQEFKLLAQADVAAWIVRRAERYGLSLQARAVAALAGLVGNQLGTLDSELQKLAAYAAGQQVSEAEVRELVSLAREPSVFAMADAVIEGRARDAVDLLHRLLAEGEAPQRLLAMIARQYRLLLLAKELLERRVRAPEISARLQVQGFVIQRLLKQAPLYTLERLRRAYRMLLDADLSVKRGSQDDEAALELLVFELAALAATPPGDTRGYSRPRGGPASAPPGPATAESGRR
jgi:DNA polymerase-3 subunit delta